MYQIEKQPTCRISIPAQEAIIRGQAVAANGTLAEADGLGAVGIAEFDASPGEMVTVMRGLVPALAWGAQVPSGLTPIRIGASTPGFIGAAAGGMDVGCIGHALRETDTSHPDYNEWFINFVK